MMDEYVVYYHGKIAGGIYNDRFLVKPVKSAIAYMLNARYELSHRTLYPNEMSDSIEKKSAQYFHP